MKPEISPALFFSELLLETENAFKKSKIFKLQKSIDQQWGYSICGTPILKEKSIIFGINWGGTGNYSSQTEMPTGSDIADYHFFKQSKALIERYFQLDIKGLNFNYTNLCLFRSPKENDLDDDDYRLSLPLFEKYVRYINPPWLLSIGATNFKKLNRFGVLQNIKSYFDNENRFSGHSGQIWGYNFFSVPHPGARLSTSARQTIWRNIATSLKIDEIQ